MFKVRNGDTIKRKTNISYSLVRTRTLVYQGVRNARFSEILAWFITDAMENYNNVSIAYPLVFYVDLAYMLAHRICKDRELLRKALLFEISEKSCIIAWLAGIVLGIRRVELVLLLNFKFMSFSSSLLSYIKNRWILNDQWTR